MLTNRSQWQADPSVMDDTPRWHNSSSLMVYLRVVYARMAHIYVCICILCVRGWSGLIRPLHCDLQDLLRFPVSITPYSIRHLERSARLPLYDINKNLSLYPYRTWHEDRPINWTSVAIWLQLGFSPVAVVQQYNREVTHITHKQSTNTIQKH
jgi:hypothetical protein